MESSSKAWTAPKLPGDIGLSHWRVTKEAVSYVVAYSGEAVQIGFEFHFQIPLHPNAI